MPNAMLVVRWRVSARAQFRSLLDYISDRNEAAADRLEASFEERIARLGEAPAIGRPGRVKDTREFILHPNYIAIYQVSDTEVTIIRVLHTSRRYP
jgi:toxin ParE1/3/4